MFTIIVGLALVSYSSILRADEYKDPADAAYCVGSLRKQYELTNYDAAMHRDAELKLSERQNLVDGSIKQGVLFAAIASRMIDNGYADADVCTQTNNRCTAEHLRRLQNNVDKASSEAEFDDCTRPIIATCNRIHRCDG